MTAPSNLYLLRLHSCGGSYYEATESTDLYFNSFSEAKEVEERLLTVLDEDEWAVHIQEIPTQATPRSEIEDLVTEIEEAYGG